MLIDPTLYNWSQTAPITITLEALEQEVASAVPVRIYKVSGTAQVTFYEDAEKPSWCIPGRYLGSLLSLLPVMDCMWSAIH